MLASKASATCSTPYGCV